MADSPQTLTALSGLLAEQATDLAQAVGNPLVSPAFLDMVRRAQRVDDLAGQVLKLMEELEDHDDVQNVAANFDISDEEMAQFSAA